MQKLEQFDSLLEQGSFVRKKRAEGKEEGLIEGRIEMLQTNIVSTVQLRFPQLAELAQLKVSHNTQLPVLNNLFNNLVVAPDEQTARSILDALSS